MLPFRGVFLLKGGLIGGCRGILGRHNHSASCHRATADHSGGSTILSVGLCDLGILVSRRLRDGVSLSYGAVVVVPARTHGP